MRAFHGIAAAAGIASLFVSFSSHAADQGIYAGLSVGQVKTDFSSDIDGLFDGKDSAFKLVGGYRMLDWFGVEVSYVDLGEITQRGNVPGLTQFRLEESGFNVFGMFYYDIAMVDLFAKGGIMQSQMHVTATASGFFPFPIDESDNSTDFAWGVGAQARFGSLGVRLEYEHFELDAGSGFDAPDLISLGATWTFF
jgi:OOP family OmpA-OmpF porin